MQVKKAFICFILEQLRHLTLSLVARPSLIAINTFQSHADSFDLKRAL